jgi:hypothetical protein
MSEITLDFARRSVREVSLEEEVRAADPGPMPLTTVRRNVPLTGTARSLR